MSPQVSKVTLPVPPFLDVETAVRVVPGHTVNTFIYRACNKKLPQPWWFKTASRRSVVIPEVRSPEVRGPGAVLPPGGAVGESASFPFLLLPVATGVFCPRVVRIQVVAFVAHLANPG